MIAGGSSLGGVIFPIVLQRLLPRIGFGWSIRVLGLLVFVSLTISCLTMKTRLPKRPISTSDLLKFIDLGGFKDIRFSLITLAAFFMFYGLFIPYFNIKQYAIIRGMDPNLASYLLPIINALGIPARVLSGYVADKVGVLNLLVPLVLISGILNLALWLPSTGNGAIIAFAVLYGGASGALVSLLPAYVAKLSPPEKGGARLGAVYAVVAIANLVGTPTGGAFLKGDESVENYRHLIGFTGAVVTLGGILCLLTRTIDVQMMKKEERNRREGSGDEKEEKKGVGKTRWTITKV